MTTAASWRQRLSDSGLGTIHSFIGSYAGHLHAPFGVHLRSLHRSPATIYRYWLAASQLERYLADTGGPTDVSAVGRSHVEAFIAASFETHAPTTVEGRYQALLQFFAFVAIDVAPAPFASPMAGMKPPSVEAPMVQIIPDRVLAGMLAQVEGGRERKTFEQIRDAAIIRLFMDTGARLNEVTSLTLEDFLPGDVVRVWGKSKGGGKVERHIPYGDKTTQALRRYLRARAEHPMASSSRVWLGLRGPMTTSGIRQMIWKRSAKAGQRVHPHQFRHTFAHNWKKDERRKDGDLKYLAGWRTDAMLERYGKSAAAERAIENYRDLGSPMGDL